MTDTTKLLAMADRFDWRAKQLYMIDKERAELCRSDAAELRAIALEPLTGKQINDAGISRDLADLIERAIAQPAEAVEDQESKSATPDGAAAAERRLTQAEETEHRTPNGTQGTDPAAFTSADAAQGAVAPDLQALLNGLWPKGQDTHPQAAPAQGDVPPEVRNAIDFLTGLRVFVTSRQRIKEPEGDNLFDESVATIRKWLAAAPSQEGES